MITLSQQLQTDGVKPSLLELIEHLIRAAADITKLVNRGELEGITGQTKQQNIQGEVQQTLDIEANRLIKNRLLQCSHVKTLASEEEDTVVPGFDKGEYAVAFDPLDGSSNIAVNGQIGTIFSILPATSADSTSELHFKQAGHAQLAAGYVLYGPATSLMLTTANGTRGYTWCNKLNTFVRTFAELKLPTQNQQVAINFANHSHWPKPIQSYLTRLLTCKESGGEGYNMRWNAAMVSDVHRVMLQGGCFVYPQEQRTGREQGKLRLLYEAAPMAMLIENAGGLAYSGQQRILDIEVAKLHQRVPVVLGSPDNVRGYLNQCN